MPTYETLFITPPNLTEDEEKSTVEGLVQIVTDGGGSLTVTERVGRRRLAYPIRKFDDGVYTRLLYDSEVAVPKELERRIRLSDRVLRSLTVRLEEEWAVISKEQALRDQQRRVEAAAEAERQAALEAEKAAAAPPETEATETETETATAAATGEAAPAKEEAPTTEPEAVEPAQETAPPDEGKAGSDG